MLLNLMKLPRFMLAQNQKAKLTDLFILHARKPAFIARVLEGSKLELVEVYQDADPDEVQTILSQMSDWYYFAYVKPSQADK